MFFFRRRLWRRDGSYSGGGQISEVIEAPELPAPSRQLKRGHRLLFAPAVHLPPITALAEPFPRQQLMRGWRRLFAVGPFQPSGRLPYPFAQFDVDDVEASFTPDRG